MPRTPDEHGTKGDAGLAGAPRGHVLKTFAKRLIDARVALNLNQSELATRVAAQLPNGKFGRDNISHYERGAALPSPVRLAAIAKVLGVEPDWLVPSRGMPAIDDQLVPLSMTSAEAGWVWLRVNQKVPLSTATAIMAELQKVEAN